MIPVVFFDSFCPQPYDSQTLVEEALAGTWVAAIRVAEALDARVVQHNRTRAQGRYQPPRADPTIEHVVVLRDSRALPTVRALYPNARAHLWLHDNFKPRSKRAYRLASTTRLLREMSVTVVCVSDSQRRGVEAALRWMGAGDELIVRTIYNPVDEGLTPDGTSVDHSKLVFFSSPNKGLPYALDAFRALQRAIPGLRLIVGNPGYKLLASGNVEGVTYLGPQPRACIHAEVRTALCTFHPNFQIPETFGMVFAESKALGTPILTHDCGAAAEVIADPEQVLPVTLAHRIYDRAARTFPARWRFLPARAAARAGLFDAYIERIRSWRSGSRPRVGPDPRFRLAAVSERWRSLLALHVRDVSRT